MLARQEGRNVLPDGLLGRFQLGGAGSLASPPAGTSRGLRQSKGLRKIPTALPGGLRMGKTSFSGGLGKMRDPVNSLESSRSSHLRAKESSVLQKYGGVREAPTSRKRPLRWGWKK